MTHIIIFSNLYACFGLTSPSLNKLAKNSKKIAENIMFINNFCFCTMLMTWMEFCDNVDDNFFMHLKF